VGGVGGVGGTVTFVSTDSPLMTDAMIKCRDGIVGAWAGAPETLPAVPETNLDDPAQLWHWEPWCRAAVFDTELTSRLRFSITRIPGGRDPQGLTLWDVGGGEPTTAGEFKVKANEIASMVRPSRKTFRQQMRYLDVWADLREDRATEILAQIGSQAPFWSTIVRLHPTRTPKTFELLDLATRFAIAVEMRFKHTLACTRPMEYSAQVQPMIQTPGHGSLPSGHSTQAYTIAGVLAALVEPHLDDPVIRRQLNDQAARIAINRTVAGVHFPVDTAAGHLLGTTLAEYLVQRCQKPSRSGGAYTPRRFRGDLFDGTKDYDPNEFQVAAALPAKAAAEAYPHLQQMKPTKVPGSKLLYWLWDRAEREWDGRGLG